MSTTSGSSDENDSVSEIKNRLERAEDILSSEEETNREYVIASERPAAESILADGDVIAYEYHEVPLSDPVLRELQSNIADYTGEEIQSIKGEGKRLEEYDITNSDLDHTPSQYVQLETIDHVERYYPLLEEDQFEKSDYESESDIDFQALRVTSQVTGEQVIAFQKFTRRQISAGTDELRVTKGDRRYSEFEDAIVTIPQTVDCILFEDSVFISRPKKFEDIFDYLEQYKRQANEVLSGLEDSNLSIHNMTDFVDSITGDRRALRKMDSVERRGLYNELDRSDVEGIVQEFDLGIEIETNEDNEWGITIPDMRKKWDVIRLLNDDHLQSYLTNSRYQVYGKDERN